MRRECRENERVRRGGERRKWRSRNDRIGSGGEEKFEHSWEEEGEGDCGQNISCERTIYFQFFGK